MGASSVSESQLKATWRLWSALRRSRLQCRAWLRCVTACQVVRCLGGLAVRQRVAGRELEWLAHTLAQYLRAAGLLIRCNQRLRVRFVKVLAIRAAACRSSHGGHGGGRHGGGGAAVAVQSGVVFPTGFQRAITSVRFARLEEPPRASRPLWMCCILEASARASSNPGHRQNFAVQSGLVLPRVVRLCPDCFSTDRFDQDKAKARLATCTLALKIECNRNG